MNVKVGEYRTPSTEQLRLFQKAQKLSITSTNAFYGLVLDPERGHGATLYDVDGNEYFSMGLVGTDNFGFGPSLKRIFAKIDKVRAVPQAVEQDIYNTYGISAKEMLVARTPLFGSGARAGISAKSTSPGSGSDSNEWALDVAIQRARERRSFACFWGAFHGRNAAIRGALDPRKSERVEGYALPHDFFRVRFPDRNSREDAVLMVEQDFESILAPQASSINAFFMEIVQGEGGVSIADTAAIRRLVELCRQHDILVVVDEVQSGMGRTGKLWAYEHYGLLPDIVTMGKSLGGGVRRPAGIVIRGDLDFEKPSQRSSTFGFEPGDAAAIMGAFEVLDGGLLERVPSIGRYFGDAFTAVVGRSEFVRDIRGLGLMWGVEFWRGKRSRAPYPELRDALLARLQAHGVLALGAGVSSLNPTIRLMPPLIITRREIDGVAEIFARELAWVSKNI